MDFSNERYVRLYVRETTTFRLLGWEGQALLPQVLRLCDRSGVIDLGSRKADDAVAAHLPGWPRKVVAAGLAALIRERVVEVRGECVVWPKYLEAQECALTDAQRQREARARRRENAGLVTKRDEMSQPVTDGHAESQSVTPALPSDPALPSVPSDPPIPPVGGIRADEQQLKLKAPKRIGFDSTPTPDEQRVLDALNAATGARFTAATQELRTALNRSGVDACLLVVAHLASDPEWQPGGEMARFLDPITPFRPKAWETRLAKARAWEESKRSGRPAPASISDLQRTQRLLAERRKQRAENVARRQRELAKAAGDSGVQP